MKNLRTAYCVATPLTCDHEKNYDIQSTGSATSLGVSNNVYLVRLRRSWQ